MWIYAKTDTGLKRQQNQDAYKYGLITESMAWAIVCDGMGGSAAGDVASKSCVEVFSSAMQQNLKPTADAVMAEKLMVQAINSANAAIYRASSEEERLQGMGTTVVACTVIHGRVCIANVGDSRAYLIHDGVLTQLTTDHSIVQSMVESGQLTEDEAKNHPNKNIITRAVGVDQDVAVDLYTCDLQKEDILLLCTDGLTNCVDCKKIVQMALDETPAQLPERLIQAALAGGGSDNITAVVIQL